MSGILSLAFVTHLATTCTVPGMVPDFWPAVIKQEARYGDGFSQFALHDDTTARTFYPDSAAEAEAAARNLMAQGHSVGIGLSQLTARTEPNFTRKFGLTIREALDACTNMKAGAKHYVRGALSTYNSGTPDGAPDYARRVVAAIREADPAAAAPQDNMPIVFSPGDRNPKSPAPAWDAWGTEATRRESSADPGNTERNSK